MFALLISLCAVVMACAGGDGDDRAQTPPADQSPPASANMRGTAASGEDRTPAAPAPTRPPATTASATLSVDADPASPSVDSDATFAPQTEFEVVLTLDQLAETIAGYQVDLAWDSTVVTFVAITNAAGDAFPACSRTLSGPGSVSSACLRTEGDAAYNGPLARIRLRCAAAGETEVSFRLPAAEVVGTRLESTPARNIVHQLTLVPATITCA
jgi:hypothetical protein